MQLVVANNLLRLLGTLSVWYQLEWRKFSNKYCSLPDCQPLLFLLEFFESGFDFEFGISCHMQLLISIWELDFTCRFRFHTSISDFDFRIRFQISNSDYDYIVRFHMLTYILELYFDCRFRCRLHVPVTYFVVDFNLRFRLRFQTLVSYFEITIQFHI